MHKVTLEELTHQQCLPEWGKDENWEMHWVGNFRNLMMIAT